MSNYEEIDFASDQDSILTPMNAEELKKGITCGGQLDLGQINWLIKLALGEIKAVAELDDFLTGISVVPDPTDPTKSKLVIDLNEADESVDLEVEIRNGITKINDKLPDANGNFDICAKTDNRVPDQATKKALFCDQSGMGKTAISNLFNPQDLCNTIPERDPDKPTQKAVFCDQSGMGKYQIPAGIISMEECPTSGSDRPSGLEPTEKFYWATGTGFRVLMVEGDDGKFYSLEDQIVNYNLAQNGLILNGLGALPCNINIKNLIDDGWVVDDSVRVGGSKYSLCKQFEEGEQYNLIFSDAPIPYNASTPKKLSFWIKWKETTATNLPPEIFIVYLAPFDRDDVLMERKSYYPHIYGADPQDYLLNGIFTPQSIPSAGPNVILSQPLNTNDTVIHLNDVSFWEANKTNQNYRFIRFLNYEDSNGNPYFNYSRTIPLQNWQPETPDQTLWGNFSETAINPVLNTITLNYPWQGDPIPAGTRVASSHAGSGFDLLISESAAQHTAIAGEDEWREIITVAPAAKDAEPFPDELAAVRIGSFFNMYFGDQTNRPNPDSAYEFCVSSFFLGEGDVYKSPDGNLWEISVDNNGNVSAIQI